MELAVYVQNLQSCLHTNVDDVVRSLEDRLSIRRNHNDCVNDESCELAKVNCKRKAEDDTATKPKNLTFQRILLTFLGAFDTFGFSSFVTVYQRIMIVSHLKSMVNGDFQSPGAPIELKFDTINYVRHATRHTKVGGCWINGWHGMG